MKKLMCIVILTMLFSAVDAQYRSYKNQYEAGSYNYQKTDPYNPTTAGFLSIVPGLGHCYVGEPLRGAGFFGLTFGSLVLTVYGVSQVYDGKNKERAGWLLGGGTAMFVGTYIWSIADVTRVAKIKNMHFRDKNLAFHLYPSLQTYTHDNAMGTSVHGLTLTVNF